MKMSLRRYVVAGLCALALAGFTGVGAQAAYELSDEVKNPTTALLGASEIGVRVYENTAMQNMPNKDAILITSFGTTFKDTREKTIDAVMKKIKHAFPGKEVRIAFTSHIIIDRVKENEGIQYLTPEQALDQLKAEGYTRVAIVNFNIVPGIEYEYARLVAQSAQKSFKKVTLATPLMYYMGQEDQPDQVVDFLEAVKMQLPKMRKADHAVLLMAHGTPHPANAYYAVIQDRLEDLGMDNVFVYSVEGRPHLEDVLPKLAANGIHDVTLMPIMMVAGDHANNDMFGDEEDSHKSILEAAGYHVDAYLHGLGENAMVQDLFVERTREALDSLDNGKALVPYTPHGMHMHK